MILQMLTHMRVVDNGFDAEGVKKEGCSNPRKLEELWGVNGAGGDDDLSPRLECACFVFMDNFDTNSALIPDINFGSASLSQNIQVGPAGRRVQEGGC